MLCSQHWLVFSWPPFLLDCIAGTLTLLARVSHDVLQAVLVFSLMHDGVGLEARIDLASLYNTSISTGCPISCYLLLQLLHTAGFHHCLAFTTAWLSPLLVGVCQTSVNNHLDCCPPYTYQEVDYLSRATVLLHLALIQFISYLSQELKDFFFFFSG